MNTPPNSPPTASLKYKLTMLTYYLICYGIFYVVPNFFPIVKPLYLPLSYIDRNMPFLPWTFFIYLTEYVFFPSVVVIESDLERFNRICRQAFLVLFFCGTFFYFMPTTYPRPVYPVVENAFVSLWMNMVGSADTPNNCFPSMHVALATLGVWALRGRGSTIVLAYILWGLSIVISTLTTKQHYAIDIAGGFLICALAIFVEWVFFHKRLPQAWFAKVRTK